MHARKRLANTRDQATLCGLGDAEGKPVGQRVVHE